MDDTDVFGVLLQPVVHVLTDGVEVVQTGRLSHWPAAFGHLQGLHEERKAASSERSARHALPRAFCRETYSSLTTSAYVLETYSISSHA